MFELRFVEKPWGREEIWAHTEAYVGKVLTIYNGHRLSKQYHEHKVETIRVIQGRLTLLLGDDTLLLYGGQSAHIPAGTVHRMEARDGDVVLVEVSTPQLDDVVRIEDDYARA